MSPGTVRFPTTSRSAPSLSSIALLTSSDFGKPDPKIWWCTSRISNPAFSIAVAVQCDVRGSAQTRAWPPGLSTRRHSAITVRSHAIHESRPPLSPSQSFPMNAIPAGGSVTTACTLASGIARIPSRQSPGCSVQSSFVIRAGGCTLWPGGPLLGWGSGGKNESSESSRKSSADRPGKALLR